MPYDAAGRIRAHDGHPDARPARAPAATATERERRSADLEKPFVAAERTVPIVPLELSRDMDRWEPIEAPRVAQIFAELLVRHGGHEVNDWVLRLEDDETVCVGPHVYLRARRLEDFGLSFEVQA